MNILSWNCRGLGKRRAIREMSRYLRTHNPQILFLMETKKRSSEMEWLRSLWNFENCFTVDSIGRGGGLALLWTNSINMHIQSYFNNHIDAIVKADNNSQDLKLTGFYGHSDVAKRHTTWHTLRTLGSFNDYPWICLGDFKKLTSNSKKIGGNPKPEAQLNAFRDIIAECDFQEFPIDGPYFT